MLYRVIDAAELPSLVSAFMETYEVVAPVKRDQGYAFETIESPDDIELAYPTTMASPKKYFLPPEETLMSFDEDRIEFRHATRRRQEAFNDAIPDIQDVAMLMDAFHKDPFWEELGGRCLSCTACSAVCPTCFCFDIQDTFDPSGEAGRRERVWDACTAPQFAQVAGGHNFRGDGRNRVRHRMYHKLNGFLANHDRMLCVGCGRCVKACKANINPIEVLEFFERKGMQDAQ